MSVAQQRLLSVLRMDTEIGVKPCEAQLFDHKAARHSVLIGPESKGLQEIGAGHVGRLSLKVTDPAVTCVFFWKSNLLSNLIVLEYLKAKL